MNLLMFILNKAKSSTTETPNASVGRWEMVGWVIVPKQGGGSGILDMPKFLIITSGL